MSKNSNSLKSSKGTNFPKAILSVSRQEHYQNPVKLKIFSRNNNNLHSDDVDPSSEDFLNDEYWQLYSPLNTNEAGPLPSDLRGHVFVIGSSGSFDSPTYGDTKVYLPTQDGWQHMWSGDGMIYRFDFHTSILHSSDQDKVQPEQKKIIYKEQGWASVATRMTKTPDFYADRALNKNPIYSRNWPKSEYEQSIFRDAAITRLSLSLGNRNYLNTAWLPLKPKGRDSERLLVTWDAGRPYEIDPCSLDLVAPVGLTKDWKPVFDLAGLSRCIRRLPGLSKLFPILSQVFPMILATAHPVYDEYEDAVYLINGTKSIKNTIQIPRLLPYFIQGLLRFLGLLKNPNHVNSNPTLLGKLFGAVFKILLWIIHSILSALNALGIGGRDCLFLYRWQGQQTEIDDADKWEIVDERGWSIPILQSAHQMALTKDFIIISDSSYKLVLADILPSLLNPQDIAKNLRMVVNGAVGVKNLACRVSESLPITTIPRSKRIPEVNKNFRESLQFLFSFLNFAQTPYTDVYIVPRAALDSSNEENFLNRKDRSKPRKIKAKHFQLAPETAHFLASYDNPENKIILHVGHIQGLDPAEFINKIDEAVCNYTPITNSAQVCPTNINKPLQDRSGILANSLAPNQIGTWVLDIKSGKMQASLTEDDRLQTLAFFTLNEKTLNQVTDVFWSCGGAWPYLHTINHLELYKNQIDSKVIDQQINLIAKEGRPSNLVRVNQIKHPNEKNELGTKLTIEDFYAFPPGYHSNSPQFVPKADKLQSVKNGYIVCVVLATNHFQTDCNEDQKLSELWIFDAANLSQGPLYRLKHPKLNIGSTLHTTWLSKLESPISRVDYDIKEDYKAILNRVEPEPFRERVLDLFERDVFPKATPLNPTSAND